MIGPAAVLTIGMIGATIGILGYTYHQGRQSCISYYEAQILNNKLENQKKEIVNYKEASEYNDQLAGEAMKHALNLEIKNAKLQAIIDSITDKHICVDADFLRELRELRGPGRK